MPRRGGWLGLVGCAVACSNGINPADGAVALMQVPPPAVFHLGEPPTSQDGGVGNSPTAPGTVVQSQIDFPVSGDLGSDGVAAGFQLVGDVGYWTVPASVSYDTQPPQVTYNVSLSFSQKVPVPDSGRLTVNTFGIDAQGNFGPVTPIPLQVVPNSPLGAALVIELTWDTEADLDLHVFQPPDGGEIWSDKRQLAKVSSPNVGYLDFDSNPQCLIDGRREENVIFRSGNADGGPFPPPGLYTVRVDTWSLCGKGFANWMVKTYLRGQLIAQSDGEALPADTRPPHGANAGLTVQTFVIAPDGGLAQ